MSKIAFFGLGRMGYPMARHLVAAGHDVCVYNRSADVSEAFCAAVRSDHPDGNLSRAATPLEAARDAEFAISILGDDTSVRDVFLGPTGALRGLRPGSIIIDHTTTSATLAKDVAAEATALDVGFVDAPVSGGEAGAQHGVLTIMCGANKHDFARATSVMAAYGKTQTLIGPVGDGQRAKMVNQLTIAGLLQSLAEALQFGVAAGLDMDQVLDSVSAGAAGSWQMTNRAHTMIDGQFDFGFAIDHMRKDLRIALDESRSLGVETPVADLVKRFYDELSENGDGSLDTSALIRRLRD